MKTVELENAGERTLVSGYGSVAQNDTLKVPENIANQLRKGDPKRWVTPKPKAKVKDAVEKPKVETTE